LKRIKEEFNRVTKWISYAHEGCIQKQIRYKKDNCYREEGVYFQHLNTYLASTYLTYLFRLSAGQLMGYIGPDDLFPGLHEALLGQGEARRLLLGPPEQKEGFAKAKPSK
jgi:hypothetical protein